MGQLMSNPLDSSANRSTPLFDLKYWYRNDWTLALAVVTRHAADNIGVAELPSDPADGYSCCVLDQARIQYYSGVDGWMPVDLPAGYELRDVNTNFLYRVVGDKLVRQYDPTNLSWDIGIQLPYVLDPSEIVLNTVMPETFYLWKDAPGSTAVVPAVQTTSPTPIFTIRKNGTDVGTFGIPTGGNKGAFLVASEVRFAKGDIFSIHAPVSPEVKLLDLGILIRLRSTTQEA